MKINIATRTVKRTTKTIRLDRMAIMDLLNDAGVVLTKDAEVTFTVPGGGDWSNLTINIDEDRPVTVTWTEVSEEGERDA